MATRTPRTAVLNYLSSVQTEDCQNKTVRRRSVATKADGKRPRTSEDTTSDETPRHLIQNMLSVYDTAQPATRQLKRLSMAEGSAGRAVLQKNAVHRSVSVTPDLETGVKKLTPRTNIVGFLEQAPEETPVTRQAQTSTESHLAPNISTVVNEAGVSMVEDSFSSADKTQIMERGARFWGKRGRLNILPPQVRPVPQTQVDTVQTPQPEVTTDDEEQASIREQRARNIHEYSLNKDKDKSNSLSKDTIIHGGMREVQSEERNVFADVFGGTKDSVFTTSDRDLPGENHMSDPDQENCGRGSVLRRQSDFEKTSRSMIQDNASHDLSERESSKTPHASPSSSPATMAQASINFTPRQLESPRRVSERVRTSTLRNMTLDTLWKRKKGQTPADESSMLTSISQGVQHSKITVPLIEQQSGGKTENMQASRESGKLKKSSPRISKGSNLDHAKSPEMGVEGRKSRTSFHTHSSVAMQNSDSSLRTSRDDNLDHTQTPETGIEGRKSKTPLLPPSSLIMQASESLVRTPRGGNLDHSEPPQTGDKRTSRISLTSKSALAEHSSDFPVTSVAPVAPDIQERSRSNLTVPGGPLLNASASIQETASIDPQETQSEEAVQQQMEDLGESRGVSVQMSSGLSASAAYTEPIQHHDQRESSGDEGSSVYSPLRTPKLKTKPTTPRTSTPVKSLGNATNKIGLPGQKRRAAPSSRPAKKSSNGLPASVVKGAFTHFCNLRLTKEALTEVEKVSDQYWRHIPEDLEAYAVHAHRKIINEADVELLMKRQSFITSKCSLNTLIATYLPLELRQELIPIARSGNKVEPTQ